MSELKNAVSSELAKLSSLRSTWIFSILLTGSLYGPPVLILLLSNDNQIGLKWSDLLVGHLIFLMIAIIFGAMLENTTPHAFLTQKRRSSWLVARAIVISGFIAANFVVGSALSILVTYVLPRGHFENVGIHWFFSFLVAAPLFAVMSLGLAAVVRNRVAAIGIPLVWLLVIEPLIYTAQSALSALKPVVKVLPGRAPEQFNYYFDAVRIHIPTDQFPAPALSAAVVVACAAVLFGLGLWANHARDTK